MVAKGSQERVRTLLKDTITLLCKNGLEFKDNFTVEALIGVTLDNNDVMLISMNEMVRAEASCGLDESDKAESQAPDTTSDKARREKRKRRRSTSPAGPKVKVEPESPEHTEPEGFDPKSEDLWGGGEPPTLSPSTLEDTGDTTSVLTPAGPSHAEESSEGSWAPVKSEQGANPAREEEEEEEEEEDIVFVKEEGSDRPSCSRQSGQRFRPQGHQQPTDPTLVPLSASDGSMFWSQASYSGTPQRNFNQRTQRTPSTMSAGPEQFSGDQTLQSSQQQNEHQGQFQCSLCNKSFTSKRSWQTHVNTHNRNYRYYCHLCNKGFMATNVLRGHMSWHNGVKEFKCQLCPSEFRYKGDQKKHYTDVHGLTGSDLQLYPEGWKLSPQNSSA